MATRTRPTKTTRAASSAATTARTRPTKTTRAAKPRATKPKAPAVKPALAGAAQNAVLNPLPKPEPKRVRDFMTVCPLTIGLSQPLSVAHEMMRARRIRHLPVLDNGDLVGVVSIGDLHLIETLKGVDPSVVTVEEAMTPEPYAVKADAPIGDVALEMATRRYGSAIVMERGKVVGMFTTVDALYALAMVFGAQVVERNGAPVAGSSDELV